MTTRLFKLRPYARHMMWAGPNLSSLAAPLADHGYGVGEALDASGLQAMSSTLVDGEFDGRDLGEFYAEDPQRFVGSKVLPPMAFPILVKRLDAGEILSLQVHPDDEQAKKMESAPNGKSEAWVILEASADAAVYLGIKEGISKEVVEAKIRSGRALEVVRRVPVAAGDIIPVPARCIHAIGGGILLFEVQQPADITYRLFDYDRKEQGIGLRELHLDQGLSVLDTELRPEKCQPQVIAEQEGGRHLLLCELEPFRIEALELEGAFGLECDRLTVLQCQEGFVRLNRKGESLVLEQGETAVVAAGEGAIELSGSGNPAKVLIAIPKN
ncbi:MAG: type I phosphomannose isomerase catalytic subunit [Planctomycetota bacterium]